VLAFDDIVTHGLGCRLFWVKMIWERSGPAFKATANPRGLPPLKVADGECRSPSSKGRQNTRHKYLVKDVVVTQDRSPMGAGYMSLDKGEMQWTLTYDEIDIVLEGELVITRGSEQVRGKTGDVIYIPKGSSITFGTPSWTRFVYVVFPVNWNEK
jgi:ethanolamine utilization protein EutQ (cupin superfamily)